MLNGAALPQRVILRIEEPESLGLFYLLEDGALSVDTAHANPSQVDQAQALLDSL